MQSGTVLREILIKATFNQTNFWFIFSRSCDIKSEFSYIICSYLRRLFIQNSLKWDFYWSDSKSDRYFLFKIAIYLLNCLYADRPVSALIPLQLKKRLCTTVVLFHCCTLIWGLTNNNYSLYLLWTFYDCQCQYTFVLYLHSLARLGVNYFQM